VDAVKVLEDPIRNALRQLVREKRIPGWSVTRPPGGGEPMWNILHPLADGIRPLTSDEANSVIGMIWEEAA
jgi:hypothetical protein